MVIERVLRQPSQDLHDSCGVAAELSLLEEPSEKFRIAPAVGKVREAKMAPRTDSPVAVAIVDHVDGRAVGKGKVLVKLSGPAKGVEGGSVVAVFPIHRQTR